MPFFDKIRQALGFSDGEDDIDDAIIRDDAPSNKYRHLRENADTAQATRETIRETDSPAPAPAPQQPAYAPQPATQQAYAPQQPAPQQQAMPDLYDEDIPF